MPEREAARPPATTGGLGAPVVAVLRFDVPEPERAGFAAAGERVLAALAAQRGFRSGRVGRAVDEPAAWLLVTEWSGPGAWRRALSGFDVRCELTPLLGWAQDAPGAFEVLHERETGGPALSHGSARAPDADTAAPGTGSREDTAPGSAGRAAPGSGAPGSAAPGIGAGVWRLGGR